MVNVRIYVEGGGDSSAQKAEFRQGLTNFWEKSGLKGRKPKTIVCGGRNAAFDNFCTAVNTHKDEVSILLVDAEAPFPDLQPAMKKWIFLHKRDGGAKPAKVREDQVFLMAQAMEAWFVADPQALQNYYGKGFNPKALPKPENPVESLTKDVLNDALENATKNTSKMAYSKGGHSFQLIGLVDPGKVAAASPLAKSLIDHLNKIL